MAQRENALKNKTAATTTTLTNAMTTTTRAAATTTRATMSGKKSGKILQKMRTK